MRNLFACSSGNTIPSAIIVRICSLHIWSNMFFQISFFKVARVTHRIVYPWGSKVDVADAIAEHVLPVPVLCHNSIPFTGLCGVKYCFTNRCVGVYVICVAPPFFTSSHIFSIFTSVHLQSEKKR